MNLTTDKINELIGVDESYQSPDKLKATLFVKEEREQLFREFLDIETDVSYDWFHGYFRDEHADRRNQKQDFTPQDITELLAKIFGSNKGRSLDVAAGTGGLTISKWHQDRCKISPFEYKPSMFLYFCEELSDRAIPFLLFNLMIRGMNAIVLHGNSLTREVKHIYFIQNDDDDFMKFSSLNVMPRTEMVEREFNVKEWIAEPIEHVESELVTMKEVNANEIPKTTFL